MKLNTFSEFISSNTLTFRKLLPNKSKHIFRVHIKHYCYSQTILHTFPDIKQYWRFQRVTGKQYKTVFQSLHQIILKFSESYWHTHFSRVRIKRYWYFQIVTGKQYCTHFQSLHQTIPTFSESYWQAILQTFPYFILSNNTDIFRGTGKQYYTLFQSIYQPLLKFIESSFQIKVY